MDVETLRLGAGQQQHLSELGTSGQSHLPSPSELKRGCPKGTLGGLWVFVVP